MHRNCDFLIVQETHSCEATEKIWRSQWGPGANVIFSHGTSQARGIALFITSKYVHTVQNVYICNTGRTIIVDICDNQEVLTLAAIYAPNNDVPQYFDDLRELLKNRSDKKIIIGDYNLTLSVDLDRSNTYCNNNRAKEKVESIMEEFCLKDVWRERNSDRKEYSWHKSGQINKASRIDFALISAGIDQQTKLVQYISSVMTDHRAIYVVIELAPNERGVGYWKFNTSLLRDSNFLDKMGKELECVLESSIDTAPCQRWELIKKRIKRGIYGIFTSQRARKQDSNSKFEGESE